MIIGRVSHLPANCVYAPHAVSGRPTSPSVGKHAKRGVRACASSQGDYNQSRLRNITYSTPTSTTISAELVTNPAVVSMPG